jgi:hypothetical protein
MPSVRPTHEAGRAEGETIMKSIYRPYTFNGTIFTKTVAALKKEAAARRRKRYQAKHRLDAVQLTSALLASALFAHATLYA